MTNCISVFCCSKPTFVVCKNNFAQSLHLKHFIMSKEKEGKRKSDKTAPAKTQKEKKTEKMLKKHPKLSTD